jgi:hypothetical protein
MAGIIEKIAQTPITIKQEVGISDGKTVWGNDISALAFIMSFQQSDISLYGTIQNGKVFLVSPTQREPKLPAIILCNGEKYDVKGVKPYRNMKNVLLGYRIVVAGGA